MKRAIILAAAAVAAFAATGCEDNRALGTEKSRNDNPENAPLDIDRKDPDELGAVPKAAPPVTPNAEVDKAPAAPAQPELKANEYIDSRGRIVMNAGDLSRIPDQEGPLWEPQTPPASGAGSTLKDGRNLDMDHSIPGRLEGNPKVQPDQGTSQDRTQQGLRPERDESMRKEQY